MRGSAAGAERRLRDAVAMAFRGAGVRPDDRLVVGCSHGPDSLALADVVLSLRRRLALGAVTLVYVDHGLRAAARAEGEAVVAFAASRRAAACVVPVRIDRRRGRGPEEAAREARHAALGRVADEVGARWIVLGHTASDQAETLVARLLRGTGATGLAGIPPVRGRTLRPLLAVDRAAVEAYLAARGLAPSIDASNHEPTFQRNRIRAALLPALRGENPAIDAALARLAQAMREEADVLDWAVDQAATVIGVTRGPGGARVPAAALATLPGGLAKRLVLRLAADLGVALGARHLDAVLHLARRAPAGTRSLALPGGTARCEYATLVIEPGMSHATDRQPEVTVTGEDGPFVVRTWQPGDRMRPRGLRGRSRKLQDLFTDRKVPRPRRRRAVVVVRASDGEIVWAQHIGPAAGSDIRVEVADFSSVPADAPKESPGLLDESGPSGYQVMDVRRRRPPDPTAESESQ